MGSTLAHLHVHLFLETEAWKDLHYAWHKHRLTPANERPTPYNPPLNIQPQAMGDCRAARLRLRVQRCLGGGALQRHVAL